MTSNFGDISGVFIPEPIVQPLDQQENLLVQPQGEQPQQPSFLRKLWNGLGTGVSQAKTQLKAPFSYVGNKVGGIGGNLGTRLKNILEEALLCQPDKEMLAFSQILNKFIHTPAEITIEDIEKLNLYLDHLSADDNKLLKKLAPKMSAEEIALCDRFFKINKNIPTFIRDHSDSEEQRKTKLTLKYIDVFSKRELIRKELIDFNAFFTNIIKEKQGALVKALELIQESLLSEKNGILAEGMEILKKKCLDENNGLMKQAIDQFTQLLNKEDGPLNALSNKLTEGDESIIAKAIEVLRGKLLDEKGLVDQVALRFTEEEKGIVAQAMGVAKEKINEMLFAEEEGLVAKLRKEITDKDKGVLTEAFAIIDQKINNDKDGLLVNAVAVINGKLFDENGIVDELGKRLTNEENGILTEAMKSLDKKINNEKDGLLVNAVAVINGKLFDENGIVDELSKRLTNEENGILTEAMKSLDKKINNEKDGLLVNTVNAFNKKLFEENGTFSLLEDKLLKEKDGLVAKAAVMLEDKIKENLESLEKSLLDKDGTLDKVKGRFLDKDGILDEAIKYLDDKLNEQEKGILARAQQSLSKAILDEKEGLINKAITHLNQKLREKDGPLDYLEFRLTDKDEGILVKAIDAFQAKVTADGGLIEKAAEKAGEAFTKKMTEAAGPLITRLEHLVENNVNNLLGIPPKNGPDQQQPVNPVDGANNAPENNPSGEATVPQFLSYGGSLLQKLGSSVSKSVVGSIAGVFAMGLEQVWNKMNDPASFGDRKDALGAVIANLKDKSKTGDWQQLKAYLDEASNTLKDVKLYVNGFNIPRSGSGEEVIEEDLFSDNINELQNAMTPAAGETPNVNWKEKAETEKTYLVSNAANYLTLKHVYENICGLKPENPDTFYTDLLMNAKNEKGEIQKSKLKELLFEKINQKNVNFVWRVWAKIAYFFYGHLVTEFTERAANVYFKEIFDYIEKNKTDQFNALRTDATKNFTTYLTVLNDVYKDIANRKATDEEPTLDITDMVKRELEKKKFNQGFETQELYKEFAQNIIQKTLWNNGFLGWLGKLIIGNPEEKVRKIVDLASGSMTDTRGYTHAINLVIHEQLEDIWQTLQTQNEDALKDPNLSKGNKAQLTGLVKNLFAVLERNKCDTLGELKDLVDGKSTKAKINQAVDSLFIDDVLEKVTHILGATMQTIAKEDQLQKLTYRFAYLMNSTFEGKNIPDEKEMKETEEKIAARCSQILRMAVRSAVANKFDFTGKKQQTETNGHIETLQKNSKAHIEKAMANLNELGTLENASAAANSKITTLALDAHTYRSDCDLTRNHIKGLNLNGDNLTELDKVFSGIQKQSEPYVASITQLKQHSRRLDGLQNANVHLREIQIALSTIPMEMSTSENIQAAEAKIQNLETQLNKLKGVLDTARFDHQIMKDTRLKPTILAEQPKALIMRALCADLARNNSRIQELCAAKKNNVNDPALNERFDALITEIDQKVDPIYGAHLKKKLNEIKTADKAENIDALAREFHILLVAAVDETDKCVETEFFKQIVEEKNALSTIIVQTKKTLAGHTLAGKLLEPNSLVDQLVTTKKNHMNDIIENAELKAQFENLDREITQHMSDPFLTQLKNQLSHIRHATDANIDTAKGAFDTILRAAVQAANESLEKGKTDYRTHFNAIQRQIATTQLSSPERLNKAKDGIRDEIQAAKNHLTALSTWQQQHVKPVPYVNFFPIDMKWVQDFATKVVYNRTKERTDGFIDLLTQEETYRYGLLNHLFLIPYVKSMRQGSK